MEYTVKTKVQSDELVGRFITCNGISGTTFKGEIEAILPANTKPAKNEMTKFYGKDWEKNCKRAFRAIKYDRVMFKDISDGHHIVQPLNPKMKYVKWEIS